MDKKRSFWEKLTGSIRMEEEAEEPARKSVSVAHRGNGDDKKNSHLGGRAGNWIEEENDEAELAIDVYQTPTSIIVETMVAGVKPENLEIEIARDIITIKGSREESRTIDEDNYFAKELYWGRFSRTISLPQEVEPEEVEATERHGLLTIKLQKVDKGKRNSVKVRSI